MAATSLHVAPEQRWILAAPPRMSWSLVTRFTLAMALIVMNAADVVTTRLLVDAGGREANPIADHFLERGSLTTTKFVCAGLLGVLMLVAPLRRRSETMLWFACTAYAVVLSFHLVQLAAS